MTHDHLFEIHKEIRKLAYVAGGITLRGSANRNLSSSQDINFHMEFTK